MGEKIMYDTIFARSFSRYDQKKLGYGAFLACFLIALSFSTVFKPYLGPLTVNKRLSINDGLKMVRANDTISSNATFFSNVVISFNATVEMVSDGSSNMSSTSRNDTIGFSTSSSKTLGFNYTNGVIRNDTRLMPVLEINNGSSSQQGQGGVPEKIIEPICNIEGRTEFCEMNGDIRINGKSSTVLQVGMMTENSSWIIGPYARKGDREALSQVTKWRVKTGVKDGDNGVHQCNRYHGVPAVVFSLGGYAGNNFHDYTDIIIPLYLTSRQFNGEVKFLITNKNPWWINKFKTILRNLSHYDPIDIDNEQQVHCLPTVIIGLKRDPKELTIDPSRSPHSMKEFRQFLRTTYSLKKTTAVKLTNNNRRKRPRLLILSRKKTRAFTNTKAIATMARTLGYKVIIAETDSNVAKVAETINACDVMMGVHDAGLTNMVFLPNNAILIQILPIGGFEWLARTDFEEPSKDMNLRYLEYKIKTEESTLIQQYPPHHEVIRNPGAIAKQGWNAFKAVYLQQQNVKLDIHRFRLILSRAIELLHE
ncbi:hypothetical protein ES332_A12G303600v1 [Gossypium tomentosum]|uniref:Glycosyltransferase 61 catalytic domain-containing protein n=1 Tax=Gossypium tomentosum TaxID=34277 RepID=A0A5D2N4W3_GOSTO|nr:hypothetical protein ES332_A12G303600v1 [Gossypium tomentosum]